MNEMKFVKIELAKHRAARVCFYCPRMAIVECPYCAKQLCDKCASVHQCFYDFR
jgi:hypothetical protein